MITTDVLAVRLGRVSVVEIESWVSRAWLHADGEPGEYLFDDIDVARAGLIAELRHDLEVGENSLPVVLSLLDQLYATRRQMHLMAAALEGDRSPLDPDGMVIATLHREIRRRLAAPND